MSRFPMPRLLAILAVALPSTAFAQTSPSTASPTMTPNATVSSSSAAPTLSASMSAKVEQHIKQLHDQLDITAAEEPQWVQFAQVMRNNAVEMEQAFAARANVAGMTAVDNMQSYAQLAQVHATNMQKLASAFQSLYNSFPDQQKTVADGVFRESMGKPTPSKH